MIRATTTLTPSAGTIRNLCDRSGPLEIRAPEGIRTPDQWIRNPGQRFSRRVPRESFGIFHVLTGPRKCLSQGCPNPRYDVACPRSRAGLCGGDRERRFHAVAASGVRARDGRHELGRRRRGDDHFGTLTLSQTREVVRIERQQRVGTRSLRGDEMQSIEYRAGFQRPRAASFDGRHVGTGRQRDNAHPVWQVAHGDVSFFRRKSSGDSCEDTVELGERVGGHERVELTSVDGVEPLFRWRVGLVSGNDCRHENGRVNRDQHLRAERVEPDALRDQSGDRALPDRPTQ
jgi:hypothetical protein